MTEVTAPSAAYTPFDVEQPDSISPARTFADDSEVAASQSSKLSRANSTGTEIRHGHAQSLNMGYLLEDAERRLHPSRVEQDTDASSPYPRSRSYIVQERQSDLRPPCVHATRTCNIEATPVLHRRALNDRENSSKGYVRGHYVTKLGTAEQEEEMEKALKDRMKRAGSRRFSCGLFRKVFRS